MPLRGKAVAPAKLTWHPLSRHLHYHARVAAIEADQLTRRYGRRTGIDRVSLRVPEGVLYGFLGPNGAGKTTMMRVLLGFLRPSAGRASVFGRDCWTESRRLKFDVGYLPGDLRLYPPMTGTQLLRIAGAVRRMDLRLAGADLAELFTLDLAVPVRSMSRGMRQKLGLILALAHKPRLLILDEPTSSLDPLMQDQLIRHLRQLAAAGHTIFFSSHTLSEVDRLCDRVAIVREGRLVADEALEVLRATARRQVTIRWTQGAAAPKAPPAFLELSDRRDRLWQGDLTGPVAGFLQWASGQPVEDVAIGHPDLESLFRRFYERGAQEP